jgi:hypothetical protein
MDTPDGSFHYEAVESKKLPSDRSALGLMPRL